MDHFRKLWELHPDYAAAYFQAAQVLAKTGETEEARQALTKGIEAASRSGGPPYQERNGGGTG